MLKLMNNNLNWETEQHYQMRVFWVFFFFTFLAKPQIACETSFMWEKNDITRSVFWVFLSVLGNKALKRRAIILHWKKKQLLPRTCLEVFFSSLYTKSLKKRMQNTPLWRSRITLPKNKCFWVFFIMLPIKTLKYMQRSLYLGNERTLREMCIMNVFKLLKYQNVKTYK